ncbi:MULTISPECIES: molybdenum cofactor guanylyltransferase [unclassified Novosphingobium]|uniref:molybdenum cofactor guanylyltransferase n=1 Tax=unclassified Novosphingobium TaxID=2644732 RepID=UPI00146C2D6B|nr:MULTISPECIES: molybdenum cofactor guanylyltransferase [unclassified Novosphingobium]NMN07126.1 molybdopterin-guanine dinucleotide biosynthesis protein A [Novosphingobium sp. SG919]NMN89286.1 molybdopterin-guanine dinucleotide biosynthesis protein A [Novosphingobium sp. SG916]
MILGAVLAGGQSTRFGSDKALAELAGQTLLARAVATLASQCQAVVVVGRSEAPVPCLSDRPRAGMGPLGGIAAALQYAAQNGFDAVLTTAVDSFGYDDDLATQLSPAPAYCASQPVIGLWPASAAPVLDALLAGNGKHSLRAFAETLGARAVALDSIPHNINTPADLAAAQEHAHGL